MVNDHVYAAATRFGLGIRTDEVGSIEASPKGWLKQQIISPEIRSNAFAALRSSAQNMQHVYDLREDRAQGIAKEKIQKDRQELFKKTFISELRVKVELAITTRTPFYERLVDFWGNHFAVSVKKGPVLTLAGAYEREAIRPHVTGKFVDMLLAVAHHPAMLIYLDNAQSIGPDSIAGRRQDKGLNENLAREIMELHTLGVNGGYTQTDVTTFAKVITGWSVAGPKSDNPGIFEFAMRRHEPGAQRILGRTYDDDGEAQGIRVLRDLASRPQTAHHIATKLACHFIADRPPEKDVKQLAQVFMDTGGDLPSIYHTLVDMPGAWNLRKNPKVKSDYDLVVGAVRATDRSGEKYIDYCLAALRFLGGIPYTADSPAGMPDVAGDMVGPEAMIQRVEWAQMASNKLDPSQKAMDLAALTIGPIMSGATRDAIANARHEREAVALLFGSPEFQRR